MAQIPEITPQDLGKMLNVLDKMKNPPALMVYGAPGIGKTSILKEFAEKNNYDLRVKHLSRMDATDWSGIPKQGADQQFTEFMPISIFRPLATGKKKIVVFFDELNTAVPQVLNAALDVILEKKGEGENAKFPPETIILAAGNLGLEEDGTYVEPLSAAVKTRMIQVRMKQHPEQWIEWATEKNLNKSVIAFIQKHNDLLIDLQGFKDEADQVATPRGWERISDLLPLIENKEDILLKKMIIGTVGKKAGEMFYDFFLEHYSEQQPGRRKWLNSMAAAESFYSKHQADYTPVNFQRLTSLVNEGILYNYEGWEKKVTDYIAFVTDLSIEPAMQTAFATADLKALENYLRQHGHQDILAKLGK